MNSVTDSSDEVSIQRRYYAQTAQAYDSMHVDDEREHHFALCLMMGAMDFLQVKSVLDIGSGTGRAIRWIKKHRPDILVRGIEPVEELRKVAYANGVSETELIPGNALALEFADDAFDLVCEFGVLHHIKTPNVAVAEMLRVAKKAVFISDSNNFGQGGRASRYIKQTLRSWGLWPLVNLIKTKGKGYTISEGDGLAYSYSVFNDYDQIQQQCESVHLINTVPAGINPYRASSH
jgi:ubiquinone/menaquinone biosynthesis C-methylase UbiE